MRKCARIIPILALLALTGCGQYAEQASFGYLKDHRGDYLESQIYPELYVPESMSRLPTSTTYDLPEVSFERPVSEISVIPPDFEA